MKKNKQIVTIKVTKHDINYGKARDRQSCPVALAFARALPQVTNIIVYRESVLWRHDNTWWWHELTDRTETFIGRFDCELPVKPFTFNLKRSHVEPG